MSSSLPATDRYSWGLSRTGWILLAASLAIGLPVMATMLPPLATVLVFGVGAVAGCWRVGHAPAHLRLRPLVFVAIALVSITLVIAFIHPPHSRVMRWGTRVASLVTGLGWLMLVMVMAERTMRAANRMRSTRFARMVIHWLPISIGCTIAGIVDQRWWFVAIGGVVAAAATLGILISMILAARAAHVEFRRPGFGAPVDNAAQPIPAPPAPLPRVPIWWTGRAITVLLLVAATFIGWAAFEPIEYDRDLVDRVLAERSAQWPRLGDPDNAWTDLMAICDAANESMAESGTFPDWDPEGGTRAADLEWIRSFNRKTDVWWQRAHSRTRAAVDTELFGEDDVRFYCHNRWTLTEVVGWRLCGAEGPDQIVAAVADACLVVSTCTRGCGAETVSVRSRMTLGIIVLALRDTFRRRERLTGQLTLDHLQQLDETFATTINRLGRPEDESLDILLSEAAIIGDHRGPRAASIYWRWRQRDLAQLLQERELTTREVVMLGAPPDSSLNNPPPLGWLERFQLGFHENEPEGAGIERRPASWVEWSRECRLIATLLRLLRIACRIEASHLIDGHIPATLGDLADPGWNTPGESLVDEWAVDARQYSYEPLLPSPGGVPTGYRLGSPDKAVFEVPAMAE